MRSASVSAFMERRQRERFPEVTAVVSKTGRAEISEDPMGPEQTDVLIMLKPRNQWTSATTKPELVAAMQRELGKVPGVRLSFSQPIALQVNELISGSRATSRSSSSVRTSPNSSNTPIRQPRCSAA